MFHVHALSQTLLKMVSSPSVKKRRKNCSSVEVDESITNIQTGYISQVKAVCEYGITRQTLLLKCENKRENEPEKRPGSLPVLGDAA